MIDRRFLTGSSPRLVANGSWRLVLLGLIVVLVLSGCTLGGGAPAPSATVPASGTATDGAAEPRLVGDLADRIAAAWSTVGSYRATTIQGSGDLGQIPLPAPPVSGAVAPADNGSSSQAVVDEIVLPDQRHYLESTAGSVSEFIAAGGRVYARGRFTQITVRPDLDAATWVNLDPAFISPDSSIGQFIASFIGPRAAAFSAPLADLQPDTRSRELTPAGMVDVSGRACAAYRWTDTGETGDAMTRTISIDAAGLPCSLEFASGGYTSRVTWDGYNQIAPVAAPAEWVTVGETLGVTNNAATPPAGTPGADTDATQQPASAVPPIATAIATPQG